MRVKAALDSLRASSNIPESTSDGNHPMNLMKLSIEAARARCRAISNHLMELISGSYFEASCHPRVLYTVLL